MTVTTPRPLLRLMGLGVVSALLAGTAVVGAAPAQAASVSGLRAAGVSARAVALTWDKADENAYRVRMSTNSSMSGATTWDVVGNYFEWTRTAANPTTSASRLSPGKKYYFQVKSIARGSTSAARTSLTGYSKAIVVTTAASGTKPELAPTGLSATTGGPGTVYLSWRTRGPGFTYKLQYRLASGTSWSTSATYPSAGGKLTGLKEGTKYAFRVQVLSGGKAASDYSGTWTGTAGSAGANPGITVVSYNVRKPTGSPTWTKRRKLVAANIKAQSPDVVALQEATPVSVTVSGKKVRQYQDVLNLLGTTVYAYVNADSTSGTRLAYRKARFTLVEEGSKKLAELGSSPRYAVWAILKDKQSGKKVFVITTHLEPGSNTSSTHNNARIKQSEEVMALVEANSDGLPVVVAGDMNSSRSAKPNNGPYLTYTGDGLVDPLDNATGSWVSGENAIAEHLVDAEYNTYNGFERTARRTAYPIGTDVDYILVSGSVRVGLWQTVVKLDTARRFVGTIPSDHNLVTATIHLP